MKSDFSSIMREKRTEKELSQTALAAIIGKSPQLICDIEAGRRSPSINTLVDIAKVLNISLDKIFLKQ
ncbi:MAG: helix-turn-helix transcriptional regulator [Halanaerobiales bacterium]|nr:helix-turn-helix transcriptional regulator [Halanaerobiales bacterium]